MAKSAGDEEFLRQFNSIWRGGYFEGDPTDPLGLSTYGISGYSSSLFTTYMACIRPYITTKTTALEIGPGRGAWSKVILERGAQHLYAVDAAPATHTNFWQYVETKDRATYIQANDFSLDGVPDNSIDYFFSFGVFCHLRPEMCASYIKSLTSKTKLGAVGFLQFADFDKFNNCSNSLSRHPIFLYFQNSSSGNAFMRLFCRLALRSFVKKNTFPRLSKEAVSNVADAEGRGNWYHWGIDEACSAIRNSGFEVVEEDINTLWRDPIVHFRKT